MPAPDKPAVDSDGSLVGNDSSTATTEDLDRVYAQILQEAEVARWLREVHGDLWRNWTAFYQPVEGEQKEEKKEEEEKDSN